MKLLRLPKGGIGQRTLLIFAIPLLAVVLLVGYNVTVKHLTDTRYAMVERGNLLARHLAVLCEFGMYSSDRDALQKYANSILQEPDVLYVAIEDNKHSILARSGDLALSAPDSSVVHFSAPIIRSGVDVSDFEQDTLPSDNIADLPAIGIAHVSLSRDSMHAKESDILAVGIIATTAALLASILLALLVARGVSGPIERLTDTVNELTGGRLSARTSEMSPGELGALEHGINKMASALENSQKQLAREVEDATTNLQSTVQKLEQKNRELEQARTEAFEADQAKSDFLARMSHEIRTPLSAVIGFARLLDSSTQSEEQQEYTRTITQASSQLLVVIDDILNFSKLDSNNYSTENTPFNLHDCLENVVSILSSSAHEKNLELILFIHTDVPQKISSDVNRISQVLTNLLANAIKFTSHGQIVVEVSLLDAGGLQDLIRISVTDTGIGLSEAEARQVFDPFTQADTSTSRNHEGTGLGLSISKRLVELLGGEIGVQSTPGEGSSFWFTIPAQHAEPVPLTMAKPLQDTTVLVYDSNSFSRRALRNRFLGWGAQVFIAAEWDGLLQMLAQQQPAAAPYKLLVIGLSSEEYGNRLVREILEDARQVTELPILVLIGAETHHLISGDIGVGRVHVMSKPPRSERMLDAALKLLTDPDKYRPHRPAGERSPAARHVDELAGLSVLIAEDNRFNQQLLEQLLDGIGIQAEIAANGDEACQLAAHRLYDMILMDIHMPVMGGIQATRGIRKGINRETPIIALTADVFADQDGYFQTLGLDDCLFKPVSGEQLVDILHKWKNPATARSTRHTATASTEPAATATVPAELQPGLRAELHSQLQALRSVCESGNQSGIQNHMHQLKGLADYFNLAAFRTGFEGLQRAVATGSKTDILAATDKLESLLEQESTGG